MTAAFTVGADLSTWETWWDLNRHAFLDLRRAVLDAGPVTGDADGGDWLRPSESDLRDRVLPALLRVLRLEKNPDLVTGILIALGKIGRDAQLPSEIAHYLAEPNQEIAETAAFCLGLLKDERALPALLALAQDRPEGRSFVGQRNVPSRTRAFAVYGLALFGSNAENPALRRRVVEALRAVGPGENLDCQVARVVALGLVRDEDLAAAEDLRRLLDDRKVDSRVRAQAPISLARLLVADDGGSPHPLRPLVRERLLALMEDREENEHVRASCAQALPHLVAPGEGEAVRVAGALSRVARDGRTPVERQFATIALGRLGGPEAEKALLQQLGKSSVLRPWTALALGILGRKHPGSRPAIAPPLREALLRERNAENLGAMAIALGILKDEGSGAVLLEQMKSLRNEDAKGYFALALGMVGAREAVPEIRVVVREAMRRPELQQQAVMALGLLGDKAVALDLTERLAEAKTLSSQSTIASALGWIGDRRTLDPLIEKLEGVRMTPLGRAFVAAALGMAGDREPMHWSVKIATDLNYHVAPPTLVDRANLAGVLDIL